MLEAQYNAVIYLHAVRSEVFFKIKLHLCYFLDILIDYRTLLLARSIILHLYAYFGYFDRINILFDSENKRFSGYISDMPAKTAKLAVLLATICNHTYHIFCISD